MKNIYFWNLYVVCLLMAVIVVAWSLVRILLKKKQFRVISLLLLVLAIYAVFVSTIYGRIPTDNHRFCFFAIKDSEFWREMIMNVLLFLPLGLSLSSFIGYYSIAVALFCSISIEIWQYFSGTGLAQVSDVLMNTLGCFLGSLSISLSKKCNNKIIYYVKKMKKNAVAIAERLYNRFGKS